MPVSVMKDLTLGLLLSLVKYLTLLKDLTLNPKGSRYQRLKDLKDGHEKNHIQS